MPTELRVLVYQVARDDTELAAVRAAYTQVSERLQDVPGMLGNELLHHAHDPTSLVVVSRWADLAAFNAWEAGPGHRDDTAPLRPYRDNRLGNPFAIYTVDAAY
ncbi:antibiotic biosynthesis monooxygenase [Kitasatospora sp. MAP5-34]|uniref:antibiotic biosynthesis monooxygenase family protein n=1 Tax=Kitasatospora sp. MAP5-34 TaxID=3035102 RepID=UPI0024742DB7|nr:antibiotic biosynthesis monooxygenase [Kitasatospora sp. MAP5-34]MDH6579773.1 heme-degrading monooxygenase HmoA [Kitasatospora sp. MAP5-34]